MLPDALSEVLKVYTLLKLKVFWNGKKSSMFGVRIKKFCMQCRGLCAVSKNGIHQKCSLREGRKEGKLIASNKYVVKKELESQTVWKIWESMSEIKPSSCDAIIKKIQEF